MAARKNQRRFTRVKPKAMSTRVRVAGQLHIGLQVENLSLGGAFVRCGHAPPLRSHASLELSVPQLSHPLLLTGNVTYVVSIAEATQRKVAPGFALEFQQPLPVHVQKGLEHVLRSVDPRALAVRAEVVEEPQTELTQAVPAFAPPESNQNTELVALRKLVDAHEREIERLRKENAQLRASLRQFHSR